MFNNGTEKAFIGSYGTGAGVIQFKQTRSGTEYGRFNASGYLGIGTTSPNTTLEVSSSTQTGFTFQRISNTFGSTTNNGAGTALQFYGWDAGITANIKSIRTQQAYSPSALTFETFGGNGNTGNNTLAERMRIDDYGRVGIGTTNPGRQLEVWGAAGASNGEVDIKLYDTTSATQIQLMKTGGTYSYVGIGASEGALYNYGSNLTLAVDGAYAMKFAVNGSERARISSSGYFGIGTTAPGYLLEIGTTGSSNQYTQVLRNNGSQNLELLFAASGKQTRHIGTLVSSDSFFIGRDSSVYDLVINSSGQVGIGTSSPSTPLQVNGIITSSGHSITPYAQATVTGSYTATNWYSVFANGLGLNAIATTGGVGNLTTPGTYIIYAYISTFQASGQMYWMQFSSVPFYWQGNGYTSNSGATYTFPALIGTGLSPNSEVVQLRTRMTYQSVDGGTYIDWSSNFSWSGLDGSSSGKTVIFNMVRIT